MRHLLPVCLLLLLSCDHLRSPTEPSGQPQGNGKLTVTVIESSSKSVIPGTLIELKDASNGPTLASATTNATGVVEFTVAAGQYLVVAPLPASFFQTKQVVAVAGGSWLVNNGKTTDATVTVVTR